MMAREKQGREREKICSCLLCSSFACLRFLQAMMATHKPHDLFLQMSIVIKRRRRENAFRRAWAFSAPMSFPCNIYGDTKKRKGVKDQA
jgi:hypothetical protein